MLTFNVNGKMNLYLDFMTIWQICSSIHLWKIFWRKGLAMDDDIEKSEVDCINILHHFSYEVWTSVFSRLEKRFLKILKIDLETNLSGIKMFFTCLTSWKILSGSNSLKQNETYYFFSSQEYYSRRCFLWSSLGLNKSENINRMITLANDQLSVKIICWRNTLRYAGSIVTLLATLFNLLLIGSLL